MGSAGFTKVLAARLGTSLALAGRAHDEPVLCNAEVSRRFETGFLQVCCRFAAGLLQVYCRTRGGHLFMYRY